MIALTLLIVAAWYCCVASTVGGPLSTRIVLAGVGASGQIVMTLTVLGGAGRLKPAPVAAASVVLCSIVLFGALRGCSVQHLTGIVERDLNTFRTGAREVFAWETVLLGVIFAFAGLWIFTAIAFYPPRGIDDVTYHLPPIYQTVQEGSLALLPVELRGHFAYPLNGELLFMWVVLFTRNIRWVDAPQAVLGLLGMVAVFALARRFALNPRGATLAAALFALMPVSILQAPSNYVDLISSAWLLCALVALSHHAETASPVSLALGGVAAGLLAGTKPSTLPLMPLVIVFATLAILASRRGAKRLVASFGLFSLPMLATCGYWYVRNWMVLANPVFPYPGRVAGWTIFEGPLEVGRNCWSVLWADPAEAVRIALWDPGLGSFHGGFGFVFWGFAVPAVALQAARALAKGGERWALRLLVLAVLPVGVATLFLVGHSDLFVFSRLVLVVGAPVFIAFAALVDEARLTLYGAATGLRALAVGCAAASVLAMASGRWPLMNLAPLADDGLRTAVSELKYLSRAPWDLRFMAAAWAPLDAMTRGGAGLLVYQATDWPVFWTAPTFGTEVQNRIWNFSPVSNRAPQAFLFHSRTGDPTYIGPEKISREAVMAKPRMRLVAAEVQGVTTLYVSDEALADRQRGAKLAEYYRITASSEVNSTRDSLALIEHGSILLVAFPFAAGYLVHEADGRLQAELHPIIPKDQNISAANWPGRTIYTVGAAIAGRRAVVVTHIPAGEFTIPLYRNQPVSGGGRS